LPVPSSAAPHQPLVGRIANSTLDVPDWFANDHRPTYPQIVTTRVS
jgi:hypothetical protein